MVILIIEHPCYLFFLHFITQRYLAKVFLRSVLVQLVVTGSGFKLWQCGNYHSRSVK